MTIKGMLAGLNKLNQTEVEVKQLQIELAELKPMMERAADETKKVIEQIATDTVNIYLLIYLTIHNICIEVKRNKFS